MQRDTVCTAECSKVDAVISHWFANLFYSNKDEKVFICERYWPLSTVRIVLKSTAYEPKLMVEVFEFTLTNQFLMNVFAATKEKLNSINN